MSEVSEDKNMNGYKEIILERPEALAFVRKRLSLGHFLSSYVLKTVNLEDGYISTALPGNGNIDNIYNFEYGGIIPQAPESEWHRVTAKDGSKSIMVPVHTMISHVIDTVQSFLINNDSIWIIEDDMARPADPFLEKSKTNYVTFQENVYHYLREGKYTDSKIQRTLKSAGSFLHVGVLTHLPVGEKFPFTRSAISEDMLKELAKRVQKLFFQAYDMESYVVWHSK